MNTGKHWGGNHIENLLPSEAVKRGYLSPEDGRVSSEWIAQNPEKRQFNTIVYVNGVYKGVATKYTKWVDLIDKFKITERNVSI